MKHTPHLTQTPGACLLMLLLALCLHAVHAADTPPPDDTALDQRQPDEFMVLPAEKDADGDYLVDAFETELINTYAPALFFHPGETAWLSSASHHLASTLDLRFHDESKPAGFVRDTSAPRPKTWDKVLAAINRKCNAGGYRFEDAYLTLPLDKTMLTPCAPLPDVPAGDFRVNRTGANSIAEVYRGRVMIPQHRPLALRVTVIDDAGDLYWGVCTINLFSSSTSIPDTIRTDFFDTVAGHKKKQVQLELTNLHAGLGLGSGTPLPRGPLVDWSQVSVTAITTTHRLAATYVPLHASPRGRWLKGERKLAAYITPGRSQSPEYDIHAIRSIWGTRIPNPTGGAQIYAHVYPTANYIVVQYWLFYGSADHARETHEGDWGDHIDVVLYRNDPNGTATSDATKPLGVVPAYRAARALSNRMVAMVTYNGSRGKVVFKRDPNTPTSIVESRSRFSVSLVKQLKWAGAAGTVDANGTHPVAYVAKGSHQMYPSGSVQEPLIPANQFQKIWDLVGGKAAGDVCATDPMVSSLPGGGTPVTVVPQTTPKPYSGQAKYAAGGQQVVLTGTGTAVKIVNVGELSASARQRFMRLDGKICRELSGAWGYQIPAESEADAARKEEVFGMLRNQLLAPIKNALAEIKQAEQDNTDGTPPQTTLRVRAEERVSQIKSRIWQHVVAVKNRIKKQHPNLLDAMLNELVVEVIQEVLGIHPVEPLLLLSRTQPMAGGEFIDYPGRWGRILASAGMSPLERQQASHYLGYDLPEDEQMKLLRQWRWSGPAGPAAGKPQRYLREFYRDYDRVAKQALVYGVEVDL